MNIVVLRYGGLGDILLATPLLRCVKQLFPSAAITFVTEAGNTSILANSTLVVSTHGLDKVTRASVYRSYVAGATLRKQAGSIDLYINLQPSLKSTALGFGLMPKATWTFNKDRRVQAETGKVRHAIDDFLNVLPGGIPSDANRTMEFMIPADAKSKAEKKATELGINLSTAIVINPAGTRDINRWPPDKLAEFIGWMEANLSGYTPVLIGGPGDSWLEDAIVGHLGRPVKSLIGKLSLQELGAFVQQAAVTVTGDTGPLHIAAAVGARIVCLSGAADPDRTGPSNNPFDLIVINRSLPCVPCQSRSCKRGDIACMTQMSVASVVDAVERRIKAG
jgi:ADP-heptose:LPS heptosyltransferase